MLIVLSLAFSALWFLTAPVVPWSSISLAAASVSCIETDGGNVKEKAGFSRLQSAEGVLATKPDVCTEDVLTEYYCTQKSEIAEATHACPGGCWNRACRPAPPLPPLPAAAIERRKGRAGRLSSGKTSFKRHRLNPRTIFQKLPSAPRRLPVPTKTSR